MLTCRFAARLRQSVSIACMTWSRRSRLVSRISTLSHTRLGMLFTAPGNTSHTPTVATASIEPLVRASFSTARINSAAAHKASLRSGINTAPACPPKPSIKIRSLREPRYDLQFRAALAAAPVRGPAQCVIPQMPCNRLRVTPLLPVLRPTLPSAALLQAKPYFCPLAFLRNRVKGSPTASGCRGNRCRSGLALRRETAATQSDVSAKNRCAVACESPQALPERQPLHRISRRSESRQYVNPCLQPPHLFPVPAIARRHFQSRPGVQEVPLPRNG